MRTAPCFPGFLLFALAVQAQNLLPNPGFDAGDRQPAGWRLEGSGGKWTRIDPGETNPALRVQGNGEDTSFWRTEPLPLKPGGYYALRFRGRRLAGASGGAAVAGTSRLNRDFPMDEAWREYRFVFRAPDDATSDFIRLGQWHVNGAVEFDDAGLLPVLASHRYASGIDAGDVRLGEAEQVQDGVYRFAPDFGWEGAEAHRPLWRNAAGFNSDRWVFGVGSEVLYRFEFEGREQSNGRIRVGINHHVAGRLDVEGSRDGESWVKLMGLDGRTSTGDMAVPACLSPATNLLVRLRTPEPETGLQVNQFTFEAHLADMAGRHAEGGTDFLELLQCDPAVNVTDFRVMTTHGQGLLRLYLAATLGIPNGTELERELSGPTVRPMPGARATSRSQGRFAVCPFVQADQPGEHELRFALRATPDRTLLETRTTARLGHLYDPRAGYRLTNSSDLALWWCESGWKVARSSQPPGTNVAIRPVTVSAARGELEAAQVFLRPTTDQRLLSVTASPLCGPDGQAGAVGVVINELAYVQVTRPTDSSCLADWYPDPLPPLQLPCDLPGGQAFPLWLAFRIGPDARAGDYTGEMVLKLSKGNREVVESVPLRIHVYDFELPRETHLRSALGLGSGWINRYHKLTNRADQVAVFEKYLANFVEHRISPYSFYDYAPIEVRFEGEGANKKAQVDFTRFDAWAERWLDGRRADDPGGNPSDRSADGLVRNPDTRSFNTFQLPLRGMGGGTFHERHLGELEGFKEGTPEHARLFQDYLGQVERHLSAKGWLGKAFTYWFDEPDPKDYEFVVAGQQRIKAAAPGLQRMMTEQPEKELIGHVDIWCGLTPEWTPEKVRARREVGEEVWWYICTGPKAPYVTEFIDHPGTEMRLWPWQSWQYGVTGILIWATIWWHSPTAYPDQLQNPWEDPMSWMSGYGRPVGTRSPWGNGDGRFLYPPRRDPNAATEPCLEAPISSIRWENLRDGMEDYEYFWLLSQEVARAEALAARQSGPAGNAANLAALVAEAKGLLLVPENVSKDLTHFTTDPRTVLEHREKVARTIERLRRLE